MNLKKKLVLELDPLLMRAQSFINVFCKLYNQKNSDSIMTPEPYRDENNLQDITQSTLVITYEKEISTEEFIEKIKILKEEMSALLEKTFKHLDVFKTDL